MSFLIGIGLGRNRTSAKTNCTYYDVPDDVLRSEYVSHSLDMFLAKLVIALYAGIGLAEDGASQRLVLDESELAEERISTLVDVAQCH